MNKRKFRNAGGLVGCLAVAALVGCGLYYGNSAVRSFVDGSPSAGDSSPSSGGGASVNLNDRVGLALPDGPMFAHSVAGNTLSLTATLAPSNASVQGIVWTVSDVSLVTLSFVNTVSGVANTATLVKPFAGSVTVTASWAFDPSVKATADLVCANDVSQLHYLDSYVWLADQPGGTYFTTQVKTISSTSGAFSYSNGSDYCGGTGYAGTNFPYFQNVTWTGKARFGMRFYAYGEDAANYPLLYDLLGLTDEATAQAVTLDYLSTPGCGLVQPLKVTYSDEANHPLSGLGNFYVGAYPAIVNSKKSVVIYVGWNSIPDAGFSFASLLAPTYPMINVTFSGYVAATGVTVGGGTFGA